MTTPARIRPARAGDLDQMAALFFDIHTFHVRLRPDLFRDAPIGELRAHLAGQLDDEDVRILVAEQDDRLVGYALLRRISHPGTLLAYCFTWMLIDTIVVHRDYRKRRIGSSLVDACLDLAREQKADRLILDFMEGNDGAKAFYLKKGFRYEKHRFEARLDPD